MSKPLPAHPLDIVANASAETATGFKALSAGITCAGPRDFKTLEYILLGAFVATGFDDAIKLHAHRLLEAGESKEAVRQAIMTPLGATATMVDVSRALAWFEEIAA